MKQLAKLAPWHLVALLSFLFLLSGGLLRQFHGSGEWPWLVAAVIGFGGLLALLVYLLYQQQRLLVYEFTARQRTRRELQAAYDQMEMRVENRTQELTATDQRLQAEIAEHRRTGGLLRQSERRFETLAKVAPVGFFCTDVDGGLQYVNERWCTISGLSVAEGLGREWTVGMDPGDRQFILSEWRRATRDDLPFQFEYRFPRRDGANIWVLCQMVAERDSAGQLVGSVGTLTDITAGKRVELEKSLLVAAIEQAADIVYIMDPNGIIQYANPAFYRATGYQAEEVIGKPMHPLNSEKNDLRLFQELWRTISLGKIWNGRIQNKRKDGGLFQTETTISPIQDHGGEGTNFVAVARDVTREVRLERQLRQAQKLEAIGTLAGGIAHDFNNLLTPVLGFTEIVLDEVEPGSRMQRNLQMVMDAAIRAKDLVAQILTFGRCHELDPRPIQLIPLLKESLRLLRATIPATIAMESRIDPACGTVYVDPTQFHQVVMNLCTNAAQAMTPAGGTLEVRLAPGILGDLDPEGKDQRRFVCLTVRDSGSGMEPEVLERIFDPFFTTKEAGGGTGLGLSVVHGIVQSCKGRIHVASTPGEGSTFMVYFPEMEGVVAPIEVPEKHWPRGTERLLFVDDEPLVAELGRQMLEKLGYSVWATTDPMAAYNRFAEDVDYFHAVITDQTMPLLTGEGLARKLFALRPTIPIILCTGYSELINEERAKSIGFRKFMLKPLTPLALALAIRQVLDQ